jgi:hypothetical protein
MLYEHVNKHIDVHDAFASGILSVFSSLFLSLRTRKLGTATPPPISTFINQGGRGEWSNPRHPLLNNMKQPCTGLPQSNRELTWFSVRIDRNNLRSFFTNQRSLYVVNWRIDWGSPSQALSRMLLKGKNALVGRRVWLVGSVTARCIPPRRRVVDSLTVLYIVSI